PTATKEANRFITFKSPIPAYAEPVRGTTPRTLAKVAPDGDSTPNARLGGVAGRLPSLRPSSGRDGEDRGVSPALTPPPLPGGEEGFGGPSGEGKSLVATVFPSPRPSPGGRGSSCAGAAVCGGRTRRMSRPSAADAADDARSAHAGTWI